MPRKTRKKAILITGVNGFWGARVAAKLLAERVSAGASARRIIGIDAQPLDQEHSGLEFIQADVQDPQLAALLKSERVESVCHLAFDENAQASQAAFDFNVTGTEKFLSACAAAGVRKVVLKSSTAVYGAAMGNPAYLNEEHPLQGSPAYGYNRHFLENEIFCQAFRLQAPDSALTILRFPFIIGPEADTPMTRFLMEPLASTLLGFDPLIQVIHESDVVRALQHAMAHPAAGAFNVAAEGVLPLSRLVALAQKFSLPIFHPLAYCRVRLANGVGLSAQSYWPIEPDYLRYPCVGDLKKMHTELDFSPACTAEAVLREFGALRRLRRYIPDKMASDRGEQKLYDALEQRKHSLG